MCLWISQLRCGLQSLAQCCLLAEYCDGWVEDQAFMSSSVLHVHGSCSSLPGGIAQGNTWFPLSFTKKFSLAPCIPDWWLFSNDRTGSFHCPVTSSLLVSFLVWRLFWVWLNMAHLVPLPWPPSHPTPAPSTCSPRGSKLQALGFQHLLCARGAPALVSEGVEL